MEVQPVLTVNPETGEEVLDYSNARVIDHGYIDQVQRQHQELEAHAYYEDDEGLHNRWADAIEEYEQGDEYEDDDDEESGVMDDFAEQVFDQIGEEQYQALTSWAEDNINDDFIEAYNQAIDDGDVELVEHYLMQLINLYNEEQGYDS